MKVTQEIFKKLAQEIDYQRTYSYEQRVNLFNKYSISTSTKFINPLMLLSYHLCYRGSWYCSNRYYGVSHSGAVQSAFNKDLEKGKSKVVEIADKGSHISYKVSWGSTATSYSQQITFYVFKKGESIFKFRIWETGFMISKHNKFDYYQEAISFIDDILYK